jgi:hypothetical protein
MTKNELKDLVGKYGIICAGDYGFKKTMGGHIKEIDSKGNIYFLDNDGFGGIFHPEQVDSFETKEFVIIKEKPKEIMPQKKRTPKVSLEQQYKVFFTQNGIEDYFIIEGETAQKARATALDVLKQRGLDYTENKVHSDRMR